MIHGIGVDIVETERIANILQTHGDSFIRRTFTDRERTLMRQMGHPARRAEYVAGRFSAKEALSKALGTGIGEKVSFLDMEILPDPHGKPHAHLSNQAYERLDLPSSTRIHVSISHSESLATSYVVVEIASDKLS